MHFSADVIKYIQNQNRLATTSNAQKISDDYDELNYRRFFGVFDSKSFFSEG